MKPLFPVLVTVSLLLQSLGNLTLSGGFLLNQSQIAQAFCINKNKPELKCDGKCFLAAKIKQMTQESQPGPQVLPSLRVMSLMYPSQELSPVILVLDTSTDTFDMPAKALAGKLIPVFHPPRHSHA